MTMQQPAVCLGYAQVDITPEAPVELVGFGRPEKSGGVLGRLLAQVLVWDGRRPAVGDHHHRQHRFYRGPQRRPARRRGRAPGRRPGAGDGLFHPHPRRSECECGAGLSGLSQRTSARRSRSGCGVAGAGAGGLGRGVW